MPSLSDALSPNRHAIPLLVIRRHLRLRSRMNHGHLFSSRLFHNHDTVTKAFPTAHHNNAKDELTARCVNAPTKHPAVSITRNSTRRLRGQLCPFSRPGAKERRRSCDSRRRSSPMSSFRYDQTLDSRGSMLGLMPSNGVYGILFISFCVYASVLTCRPSPGTRG